ncbi:MAG: hypothetical protein KDJ15_05820 [Alphaproteobacteria bacterium]|nr:hypothetical protein [Alphaproteobacteria bacterium]
MSGIWTRALASAGVQHIRKNWCQSMVSMFCVFALSSCGPVSPPWNGQENKPQDIYQTASAARATTASQQADPLLASPPGAGQRPPLLPENVPGEGAYTSGAPPGLQPPRGVNLETLFAQKTRTTEERFQRLEGAVIDMRSDFDRMMPAIMRLTAVESDISALLEQLETMMDVAPPPTESFEAPTDQQALPLPQQNVAAAPAQDAPPPKVVVGPPEIKRLRIGEHPDRTRLVLDLSASSPYRYDLDNSENLLVIELPEAGWNGRTSWQNDKAPLIRSWSVQPMENGKGSRIIAVLKHNASVIDDMAIKANGYQDHRIVIDLTSPSLHQREGSKGTPMKK